jgi:glycine/sarcosine N-methyltransferase
MVESETRKSLLEYEPQNYGEDPTAVRDTDQYTDEYVRGFVEKWDQLIDWDQRAESEGSFFIEQLRERGVQRVLDVATGTGFHSMRLIEAGFDVVSADGSPYMLSCAFENARRRGHVLRTVQADWRWLNRDVHGRFDAVICLGNSFTHLFSERDRRKALAEFYAALVHDGVLILDQRNYDAILDHGFDSKHRFYYCGERVSAEPEHMDDGLARFCYSFPDGSKYHLNMYPLRKRYVRSLMHDIGFQKVDTFGDFKETYHEADPDFFIHVADKCYDSISQEDWEQGQKE